MRELRLIGIGTGSPGHLTLDGIAAIRSADLILIPRKGAGKSDLAGLRERIIAETCGDAAPAIAYFDMPERRSERGYLPGVHDWHDAIAGRWRQALDAHPGAEVAALLIWGDPSLYDSALRIAARLEPAPPVRVIPGITALQALTAAHGIPVNRIGAPFLVTTGRNLREQGWEGSPDTIAVMLDGECSFQALEPAGIHIWWGAYLGMPQQMLISGPLAATRDRIVTERARARAEHGWIMDVYLLGNGKI